MRAENTLIDFPSKARRPKRLWKKHQQTNLNILDTSGTTAQKAHTKNTSEYTPIITYLYTSMFQDDSMSHYNTVHVLVFSVYFFPWIYDNLGQHMAPPERHKKTRCSSGTAWASRLFLLTSRPNPTIVASWAARWTKTHSIHGTIVYTVYLEPVCPLFWWLNPPKHGLFQSKQGSFRFPGIYSIFTYMNASFLMIHVGKL